MRLVLFALVCLASCATARTVASEAPAPSLSTVETCLAEAQPDARRACIGQNTNACTESDGGSTTTGMVMCSQAERAEWEAVQNREVAALRARESETQVALLNADLEEHERWARAHCSYEASTYEGGTLARVAGAMCMRDTIAEHAIYLISRSDER